MAETRSSGFYEEFWRDAEYMLAYQRDSAERDRLPAIRAVWGDRPPPGRVLDFGCGNGALTHWMHQNAFGRSLLGVDVSRTGIDTARSRFVAEGLAFEVVDHPSALASRAPFDVVVSSHVIEHLVDPFAALVALRPLAPLFVIEVPIEDAWVPNLAWALRRRPRTTNPVGHLHFWTRDAFHRLLHTAGYRILAEHHYASAPFSPYNAASKRAVERVALRLLGLKLYGRLMATHDAVLAAPA
jgi:SAM-dependent methyltransferase